MTAVPSKEVTTTQVTAVSFGFYTDEEVRKLGVTHIYNPILYDNFKYPNQHGLYDTAMGPIDQRQVCRTCGLSYHFCPGHFGYIDLAVPVYNPLVFSTLYKLVRCTCLHCFHFKMNQAEVALYAKRLRLLLNGEVAEAYGVHHDEPGEDSEPEAEAAELGSGKKKQKGKAKKQKKGFEAEAAAGAEEQQQQVPRKRMKMSAEAEKGTPAVPLQPRLTSHSVNALRETFAEFLRRMPLKKCANCGANNPDIKKDGTSKIFQRPLPGKKAAENKMNRVELLSVVSDALGLDSQEALEEEMEERDAKRRQARAAAKRKKDSGDAKLGPQVKEAEERAAEAAAAEAEAAAAGGKRAGDPMALPDEVDPKLRYMTPAEVRDIVGRLWQTSPEILDSWYALESQPGNRARLNLASSASPAPTIPAKGSSFSLGKGMLTSGSTLEEEEEEEKARRNVSAMFFIQTLSVVPNKFRPPSKVGEAMYEHPHNSLLTAIMSTNNSILSQQQALAEVAAAGTGGAEMEEGPGAQVQLQRSMRLWLQLQTGVNSLLDGAGKTPDGKPGGQGIRQTLEKKEGLFRKNMMGKRVNCAARSVISPDPYLGTGEIGIPPYFALRLSYPERVTPWNVKEMQEAVIRGAHELPGAVAVESETGQLVSLSNLSRTRREALAKQLLSKSAGGGSGGGKIVYRHLQNGDLLLTNRQPTLHKPGLMAHRARVLKGERTIRMHYANCSTFNADFDGDEINLHLPQDALGRAEGYTVVHADEQFIVPTSGSPIRGLIQDHVCAATLMTKKDTFFRREQYQQLVYAACSPATARTAEQGPVALLPPAIWQPRPLWTGKQVISTLLRNFTAGLPPISLEFKAKVGGQYWGATAGEESFTMHRNEVLAGAMDKAAFGTHGLVHAVQELYGNEAAGRLLSAFSRLFTAYLQSHGLTCGVDDMLMTPEAESKRLEVLATANAHAASAAAEAMNVAWSAPNDVTDEFIADEVAVLTGRIMREAAQGADAVTQRLDEHIKLGMGPVSSNVIKECIPDGLVKPFPANCLGLMTTTGAKGSVVNFSQITCLLGQQELEGRRVPVTASGKTLPCFKPYDPAARPGGFIADRFLTGLRPQEYYFHCMAGREGLVDTTVKTSRSGYLQRCIIKNIEALRVHYDHTVRDDCDGSIIQFYYGEDGVDVTNGSYLLEFDRLAQNAVRLAQVADLPAAVAAAGRAGADEREAAVAKQLRKRAKVLERRRRGRADKQPQGLPLMAANLPTLLGATSERFADSLEEFVATGQYKKFHRIEMSGQLGPDGRSEAGHAAVPADTFASLMRLKYMRSLAAAGEAVGVLAAQSIGEPSTQMTLNTFHHAGRGEANVTLGIPRLRELLMTASGAIKTPFMIMPMREGSNRYTQEIVLSRLRSVSLLEVLEGMSLIIIPMKHRPDGSGEMERTYTFRIKLHHPQYYPPSAGVSWEAVQRTLTLIYLPKLQKFFTDTLKKIEMEHVIASMRVSSFVGEEEFGLQKEKPTRKKKSEKEGEDENIEEDEENEEGKLRFAGGRAEEATYAESDDDAAEAAAAAALAEQQEGDLQDDEDAEGDEEGKQEKKPSASAEDAEVMDLEKSGSAAAASETFVQQRKRYKHVREADTLSVFSIALPWRVPQIFAQNFAEHLLATTKIKHAPGLKNCKERENEDGSLAIQCEGASFAAAFANADIIDAFHVTTNDVAEVLVSLGVEAARALLLKEVASVFKAYGIAVDVRHLGLIADFMMHLGNYRALNRLGIESSASPFLKISFETAAHFLADATLRGATDSLTSPASRVVLGRPVQLGTGAMELIQSF